MQTISKKINSENTKNIVKNIKIEVITPVIAPALSYNKYMRKLQIDDIKRCYPTDVYDLLNHVDRMFERDAECNVLLPTTVISAGLREQYQYPGIIVKGTILFPGDFVRITTKKAGNSLISYEYLVPGAKAISTLLFNQEVKLPITIKIGYRKSKGYGIIKISQA